MLQKASWEAGGSGVGIGVETLELRQTSGAK